MNEAKILERAWRAYQSTDSAAAEQPVDHCSSERVLGGLRYVVLRNNRRTLAVYRVRNSGLLRRMKRWPLALGRENTSTPSTSRRVNSLEQAKI
jgi:hypothetical protein